MNNASISFIHVDIAFKQIKRAMTRDLVAKQILNLTMWVNTYFKDAAYNILLL